MRETVELRKVKFQSPAAKVGMIHTFDQLKDGVLVNSAIAKSSGVRSDSNSGWSVAPGKETDTAVLRYNRVAMLEAVLSIRDRRQQFIRRIIVCILFLTGVVVTTAGILGWLS